jgi:hypothetical protein
MSEFSTLQPKRQNPKLPAVVPIAEAPADKKEEYQDLVKAMADEGQEDLDKKIEDGPSSSSGDPESVELPTSQVELGGKIVTLSHDGRIMAVDEIEPVVIDPAEPTEADKQAFVRSLLGNKPFEKEFVVFGEIKLVFRDRSVAETEEMYKRLDARKPAPTSPEEWAIALERELAALTCVSIDGMPVAGNDPASKLDFIMATRRGLYQTILECSRTFERMVELLVARALEPGFWKAGGAA